MVRYLIPFVAVVLFLVEPMFTQFSPIELNEQTFVLVPRFVVLYLIFISIYYNRRKAVIYGVVFGLLYDVVYIDIIGLYVVLYPLVCFLAGWSVKFIHQHLIITTVLAVLLVAVMEFVLYEFFLLISFTAIPLEQFLYNRLMPTIGANLLFLLMLGWAFKYLIDARLLERERGMN